MVFVPFTRCVPSAFLATPCTRRPVSLLPDCVQPLVNSESRMRSLYSICLPETGCVIAYARCSVSRGVLRAILVFVSSSRVIALSPFDHPAM